ADRHQRQRGPSGHLEAEHRALSRLTTGPPAEQHPGRHHREPADNEPAGEGVAARRAPEPGGGPQLRPNARHHVQRGGGLMAVRADETNAISPRPRRVRHGGGGGQQVVLGMSGDGAERLRLDSGRRGVTRTARLNAHHVAGLNRAGIEVDEDVSSVGRRRRSEESSAETDTGQQEGWAAGMHHAPSRAGVERRYPAFHILPSVPLTSQAANFRPGTGPRRLAYLMTDADAPLATLAGPGPRGELRPIRTYRRRAGRMRPRQRDALARLWPVYGVPLPQTPREPPARLDLAALFGREAPVVLE